MTSNSPGSFAQVNETVFHGQFSPHTLFGYYPNQNISDFYMFTFDDVLPRLPVNETNAFGGSTFDPIIYQTNWDPYLWGFFPDPEGERIDAINGSIDTGNLTCSNRINLFGEAHVNNSAGMVCFQPLWYDNTSGLAQPGITSIPRKLNISTHEDVYGFVNPMIKIALFVNNIFGSESFGTDISNIDIYIFDVKVDDVANFRTGNIGNSFMGKYPEPTPDEFAEIQSETSQKVVYDDGNYDQVRTKILSVGGREWEIYCAIHPKYISEKRTFLPFFIGALSVGITISVSLFRIILSLIIGKAQQKYVSRSKRVTVISKPSESDSIR